MTTYRLNPSQRTMLGFVLGTAAVTEPDVNQIKHLHDLAQKAVASAPDGTINLDQNETQYLVNAIETQYNSIGKGTTTWPEFKSGFDDLAKTIRTGAKGAGASAS